MFVCCLFAGVPSKKRSPRKNSSCSVFHLIYPRPARGNTVTAPVGKSAKDLRTNHMGGVFVEGTLFGFGLRGNPKNTAHFRRTPVLCGFLGIVTSRRFGIGHVPT